MKLLDIITIIAERANATVDAILISLMGSKHSLTAKFGNEYKLLSIRHSGFSLGRKSFSTLQSRNNLLLFAPSGVGKTTVSLIPSALKIASSKEGNSMVINNNSGELEQMTSYFLHKEYVVKRFDPNDIENSIYYNPLHRIKSASDINKVATMIVSKSSKDAKDFWSQKAIELISLLIDFLLMHTPKVHQNLANVYYLLENLAGNEKLVSGLFADKAIEAQWRKYKSVIANSDNTKASIISSAIASLSFLGNDPNLCDLTSVDTFDFSSMRDEKTVLFLNFPVTESSYYGVLLGLFCEQFFAQMFKSIPAKEDKDIFLLIDELSSIPLPNLANISANSRKFKIPILGVLQSENQLYENYGQYNAKTIINNACRVYMTGLTDECERLEKTLGSYQYYQDKEKKVMRTRSLMTADEIRTMPRDRVLVIPNGGMRPIYPKVKPYYKIGKYKKYLKMEVPEDYLPDPPFRYGVQYLSLDKYITNLKNDDNE